METVLKPLDWGVACRAAEPDGVLGDGHLVVRESGGVLIAAIDGLGRGQAAADSTKVARVALAELAGASLEQRMNHCHDRLHGTRGVALSMAWFDDRTSAMSWLGVGNVEGLLVRRIVPRTMVSALLLRGGVVGRNLPEVAAATLPVIAGDTLVFATDGIGPDVERSLISGDPPQRQAERIMVRHYRGHDDALVVVAMVRSPAS